MKAFKFFLLTACFALVALPGAGAVGFGDCSRTMIVDVPAADGVYIDVRATETATGVWIYQESNGVSGLQVGGSSILGSDGCFREDGLVLDVVVL